MTKKSYLITYEEVIDADSEEEVEEYIYNLIFFATERLSVNDFAVEDIHETQADTPSVSRDQLKFGK